MKENKTCFGGKYKAVSLEWNKSGARILTLMHCNFGNSTVVSNIHTERNRNVKRNIP